MKNSKKFLSVLLVFCMIASASLAFASFADVNESYVENLAEKGIIKGYSEDVFAPDNACTRGQFLTFLWRASGEPSVEKIEKISDVSGNEYYAEPVWWAYKNGITKIYSDNTFRADNAVDYEHAAYYLYKWAKLYEIADMTKTLTEFKYLEDGAQISPECLIPFAWAVASGFIVEDETLHTKPKEAVNRLWTVKTIGKILDTHVCNWGEWKDNGDGTHSRECEKDATHKETKEHLYFVESIDRPAQGRGFYDEKYGKFILLEGSIIANEVVKSFKSISFRNQFIKEHCKKDKGQIVLLNDISFDTPSGVSSLVLGRPSNGWSDWKDAEGKKLSDIIKR